MPELIPDFGPLYVAVRAMLAAGTHRKIGDNRVPPDRIEGKSYVIVYAPIGKVRPLPSLALQHRVWQVTFQLTSVGESDEQAHATADVARRVFLFDPLTPAGLTVIGRDIDAVGEPSTSEAGEYRVVSVPERLTATVQPST